MKCSSAQQRLSNEPARLSQPPRLCVPLTAAVSPLCPRCVPAETMLRTGRGRQRSMREQPAAEGAGPLRRPCAPIGRPSFSNQPGGRGGGMLDIHMTHSNRVSREALKFRGDLILTTGRRGLKETTSFVKEEAPLFHRGEQETCRCLANEERAFVFIYTCLFFFTETGQNVALSSTGQVLLTV